MSTPRTPTALLMDAKLRAEEGDGLVEAVMRTADAGKSYREIAWWLEDATGIRVSHETVRSWHVEWKRDAEREARQGAA